MPAPRTGLSDATTLPPPSATYTAAGCNSPTSAARSPLREANWRAAGRVPPRFGRTARRRRRAAPTPPVPPGRADLGSPPAGPSGVDRWFFIRHADPDPHLRLRLHGAPAEGPYQHLARERAGA
ncbi:lantibiotic dehydratase C-terminal domain-containing protein [Streptomyces sp. NPDC053474]|uniref:lantibiotic dehydratase C-terminal domain-containing protein n=1 Tax=Streptomyces sp. NPDC053474 TaxID=3365704 RepID=UPI0037D017E3